MPLIRVEVVGSTPPNPAEAIAEAVGVALGSPPERTWVRLLRIDSVDYAEGSGAAPAPVFVHVLQADPTPVEERESQASAIASNVGAILERPAENVHVVWEASARGRVAFGGKLVR